METPGLPRFPALKGHARPAVLEGVDGVSNMKRVLLHLLGGTRGGPLRVRILLLLRERPHNTNRVATTLGIDYKTARHHLRVLAENRLVVLDGRGYGATYRLSRDLEANLGEFDRIARNDPGSGARRAPLEGPA